MMYNIIICYQCTEAVYNRVKICIKKNDTGGVHYVKGMGKRRKTE